MSATTPTPLHHRLLVLLTVALCGVAIGGCGSSGPKASGASSARAALAFSECMRSHGVPNFPDPSLGGVLNIEGTGIDPSSPAFEAGQTTCDKLVPGGGPPAHASAEQRRRLFAISKCMRAHGVSEFPDPTIRTTPPPNPQDYSLAQGIGDLWLIVRSTINLNSRGFVKATKACGFR
jgi:hypothetical protein